ncbi:unnamed protein product [Schistosoma rodhaini]|uniref:Uncharacterized protein n=1 Tax=Schistosoma rodhaini TaxID=6188 RepID=A0AA85F8I0_9TREM|nr:unnamed protein product [Schistosoma rodhaini]
MSIWIPINLMNVEIFMIQSITRRKRKNENKLPPPRIKSRSWTLQESDCEVQITSDLCMFFTTCTNKPILYTAGNNKSSLNMKYIYPNNSSNLPSIPCTIV